MKISDFSPSFFENILHKLILSNMRCTYEHSDINSHMRVALDYGIFGLNWYGPKETTLNVICDYFIDIIVTEQLKRENK